METPRRNLEVKVRVEDLDAIARRAREIGALDHGVSRDRDTYFQAPRGRLKLRQTAGQAHATLIAYARADVARSRHSAYWLTRVEQPEELLAGLDATLGTLVTVDKTRHVFIWGATRIHLDRVVRLGSFVELETVLGGQSEADASAEHAWLKQALGLDEAPIERLSYSDLLLRLEVSRGDAAAR